MNTNITENCNAIDLPKIPFDLPEDPIVGHPSEGNMTSDEIQQGHPDTCAIRSQEIILRDFGVDVDEDTLIREATEHGWYEGSGTGHQDIGQLLELHGVSVTQYIDAGFNDLADQLEAGRKVIVTVDSGELWAPENEWLEDYFWGERADHALIVSGIDATDPENVKVIVTDPGSGDVAKAYPLEQFMDAWEDSDHFMVVTDDVPPEDSAGTDGLCAEESVGSASALGGEIGIQIPELGYIPGNYALIDTDGNGIFDTIAYDTNYNDVADTYAYDYNEDGCIDAIGYDYDEDGYIDDGVWA